MSLSFKDNLKSFFNTILNKFLQVFKIFILHALILCGWINLRIKKQHCIYASFISLKFVNQKFSNLKNIIFKK